MNFLQWGVSTEEAFEFINRIVNDYALGLDDPLGLKAELEIFVKGLQNEKNETTTPTPPKSNNDGAVPLTATSPPDVRKTRRFTLSLGKKSSISEGMVCKDGYLAKKHVHHKNKWSLRWFVLRQDCLVYYKTEKDKQPRGVISLQKAHVQASTLKQFAIEIVCEGSSYFLCAATALEQSQWIEAIQNAIQSMFPAQQELPQAPSRDRFGSDPPNPSAATAVKPISFGVAKCNFQASSPKELSFQKHDAIRILKKDPSGWYKGEFEGQIGWFPGSFVESIDSFI